MAPSSAGRLSTHPVSQDSVVCLCRSVLLLLHVGETPLLADDDLLSSGELVSGSSDSLENDGSVALTASDRQQDLANVDSCDRVVGLSVSSSHTGLQSIGTGAGQHLVDSDDVEGVNTDSHVERVLSGRLGDVLVGANSGGFECFRGDLLVLVADQVGAEGELVDVGLLSAQVEDTDLRVGDWDRRKDEVAKNGGDSYCQYTHLSHRHIHKNACCPSLLPFLLSLLTTSIVSALGERLVLAVSVASCWSSTHLAFTFLEVGEGKV